MFKNLSKYFGYPIGNLASTRYYMPERSVDFMDLWKSIKLWGSSSQGIHVFVDPIFQTRYPFDSPKNGNKLSF